MFVIDIFFCLSYYFIFNKFGVVVNVLRLMVCFFIFSCFSLEAWNETGHMLVAKIAEEHLEPDVKEEVERLLKILRNFYPQSLDLMTASTWADEMREHGMDAFSHWHYINIPYDPEQILSATDLEVIQAQTKGGNVVWGLEQALSTLKNPKSGDFEKAFMLRFLLHLTADIHQPVHTTTRYSKKFPQGDVGGNLFKLQATQKNLHSYWDSGAGLFPVYRRPLNNEAMVCFQEYVKNATDALPLPEADRLDVPVSEWAQESHELAIAFVYQIEEGSKPSQAYQSQAQQICQERVALAGYRLAHVLNQIFGKQ